MTLNSQITNKNEWQSENENKSKAKLKILKLIWRAKMKTALNFKGPFGLRMENCGMMEKWEDEKYLVFPLMCLVGGVEKWEGEKFFYLVGEKKGRMKNVIYINWLLYPCYIICKK